MQQQHPENHQGQKQKTELEGIATFQYNGWTPMNFQYVEDNCSILAPNIWLPSNISWSSNQNCEKSIEIVIEEVEVNSL